jgi:hypothetical protein
LCVCVREFACVRACVRVCACVHVCACVCVYVQCKGYEVHHGRVTIALVQGE